jgi:hypothetical protein
LSTTFTHVSGCKVDTTTKDGKSALKMAKDPKIRQLLDPNEKIPATKEIPGKKAASTNTEKKSADQGSNSKEKETEKEISMATSIAEFLSAEMPLRQMELAKEYQEALETLNVFEIPDLAGLQVTKAQLKKIGFKPVHIKRFLRIVNAIEVQSTDEL